jgi:uncharacterized protein (TIGR02996 family)
VDHTPNIRLPPTTPTPPDALLRAIQDNPDDDSLRLVYADWLEERGDVRGEFIRVQVELARGPGDARRRRKLRRRERELLEQRYREWAGPLLAGLVEEAYPELRVLGGRLIWNRERVWKWMFRRGLVEAVALEALQFLDSADALFRAHPLQEARLVGAWSAVETVEKLTALPQLRRLSALRLTPTTSWGNSEFSPGYTRGMRDTGAQLLAACPHLGGLRSLSLASHDLGEAGAGALAASPHLAGLKELDLSRNQVGAAGAAALAASRHLTGLVRLNLAQNRLDHDTTHLLRSRFGAGVSFRAGKSPDPFCDIIAGHLGDREPRPEPPRWRDPEELGGLTHDV